MTEAGDVHEGVIDVLDGAAKIGDDDAVRALLDGARKLAQRLVDLFGHSAGGEGVFHDVEQRKPGLPLFLQGAGLGIFRLPIVDPH